MTGRQRLSSSASSSVTDAAARDTLAAPESPPLSPTFVSWLGEHRWWVLVPLWSVLRAWNLYFLSPEQDTQRYFDIGGRWLLGQVPYAQVPCEYPPGALPFFALPRAMTTLMLHTQQEVMAAYQQFCQYFAAEMVVFDLIILMLMARLSHHLLGGDGSANRRESLRRGYLTCAQLVYITMVSALGKMAFQRFDLVFGALVLGFMLLAIQPQKRYWASIVLAVSVWVKVASLPLVPLYLAYLWLESGQKVQKATKSHLQNFADAARVAWPHITTLVTTSVALFVPFYVLAGSALYNFVTYQSDRGLQIESTYASVLMLFHLLFGAVIERRFAYGASEVVHQSSVGLTTVSGIIVALAVLLAVVAWVPRQARLTSQTERRLGFLEGVLGLMLVILFTNKVFSPQFLLWVAPLAGMLMFSRRPTLAHDFVAVGAIQLLTTLIVMFYYMDLLQFDGMPTIMLVTRNFAVGGLGFGLMGLLGPADLRSLRDDIQERLVRPRVARSLGMAAVALCGVWVFVANMSETTANDIWIQLRSGADIWRSWTVPQVEQYSATVSGHPFIAHEWLSGLWFFVADLLLGDMGLSLLTALTALGIFVTLYYAFEKRERHTFWYLPLLIYINYLIAFRLLARPHIFTILAQAIMITAIERWRRTGKLRTLVGLVPMQVVWINLHGAALFGPALMGMVCGCVALMTWVPVLGQSEPRRMTHRDIVQTAGMTGAMALACLINPYHIRIVTFSLDLMGNEYAKNRVWEWTTPFLGMNTYYYWLYIFMVLFVVLWGSLVYRARQLPLLDAAYTILASYLGLRANRFMPDFAILAFPVVVRSFDALMREAVPPRLFVRRPWFDIGMAALLFCNCAVYGYAHSAREHRPLFGWGYGGDMPFVEVDLMKKLRLRGTIYNEYSDGSLIINRLVPDIKPVLDSRIDLYPLDFVDEYDRAYLDPQLFASFLKRRNCNIVMLYKTRTSPAVLQFLAQAPEWRLLLDTNGRVLYATESTLAAGRTRERAERHVRRTQTPQKAFAQR